MLRMLARLLRFAIFFAIAGAVFRTVIKPRLFGKREPEEDLTE